jgi:hypothetical protein
MLINAKKAEKVYGGPILEELENNGFIPSPFHDTIEEGIMNKVASFSRKLDEPFTREFGRQYHELRQKAWKKALQDHNSKKPLSYKFLQGANMCPRDDMYIWDKPKNTYIESTLKIELVPGTVNSFKYNTFEASQVWSGLAKGACSLSEEWLSYKNTFEMDDMRVYIEELDELKYIYKGFWHLSRINRIDWLSTLYRDPERKMIDYNLPSWRSMDGMNHSDDTVVLSVEGIDLYISVEKLFEWICWYRLPKKRYPIGGCEDNKCVAYALYLEDLGIPPEYIRQCFTLEVMKDVENFLEVSMFPMPSRNEEEEDESEAWLSLGYNFDSIETIEEANIRREAIEAETTEIFHKVNINFGNIDLSQLELGEEDSQISEEDRRERAREMEENMPYERDLHASNNEFEVWYEGLTREKIEEHQEWEGGSEASDDMPDNKLTPIEELGIDLIDPSRDSTMQPSLSRIGMVWNPGGGKRTVAKRYNFLGKSGKSR